MNGLNKMCNTLEEYSIAEMSKGKNAINTKEFGEVVDMMKDLSEVKKNNAEACYYMAITEAMENSEYGEDYDYEGRLNRRGYRMPSEVYRVNEDRLYYGNMNRNMANGRSNTSRPSGSRYGYSHDDYMDAKRYYSTTDPEGKRIRMEKLEDYTDDLVESAKEMIQDMSPEEKQAWKMKLSKIINM